MIDGAFQLIREKGHESLTARNLAALLGCSTQPIMYQFPNLDMLRDLAYQKADAFHSEYILTAGDLLEIGMSPESAALLTVVSTEEGLATEDAALFFEPLAALVHGYASLIANNGMKYDPDAIRKSLTMIEEGIRKGKNSND